MTYSWFLLNNTPKLCIVFKLTVWEHVRQSVAWLSRAYFRNPAEYSIRDGTIKPCSFWLDSTFSPGPWPPYPTPGSRSSVVSSGALRCLRARTCHFWPPWSPGTPNTGAPSPLQRPLVPNTSPAVSCVSLFSVQFPSPLFSMYWLWLACLLAPPQLLTSTVSHWGREICKLFEPL